MNLTDEQLRTLRHMLGIDDPYAKHADPTRDYYCATPGDPQLHELMRLGAVRLYAERDGYQWFTTTDEGWVAAVDSHRTIRASKGKRLYSKFLEVRDCCPDMTFRKFLTDPALRDTRRGA